MNFERRTTYVAAICHLPWQPTASVEEDTLLLYQPVCSVHVPYPKYPASLCSLLRRVGGPAPLLAVSTVHLRTLQFISAAFSVVMRRRLSDAVRFLLRKWLIMTIASQVWRRLTASFSQDQVQFAIAGSQGLRRGWQVSVPLLEPRRPPGRDFGRL